MSNPQTSTLPKISDPRIFLGLPAYGRIDVPFVTSLMDAIRATNCIATLEFLNGDSLVSRARNNLAHRFLKGTDQPDGKGGMHTVLYDWLLFIDTDLQFRAQDVQALYELAVRRGPNIYAGTYPIKTLKPKVVFNGLPGASVDAEGVLEVRETGTGFMLIHRKVFEQMIEKFRDEIEFLSDQGDAGAEKVVKHDFFTVGVRRDPILGYKRFLSEDWYFCQRWREIGGKVFLHTRLQANHIGTFSFPANPAELLEAADIYQRALDAKKAAAANAVAKVA